MRTTEQTKNLRNFIRELWAIPAEQFAMTNIHTYGHACGAVCCIEGWRELILGKPYVDDVEKTLNMYPDVEEQFGIPYLRWHSIMHCGTGEDNYSFDAFDSLPPEQRKLCMIDVLEQELRTGTHSWDVAVVGVCGPDEAARLKGMKYENTAEEIQLSDFQFTPEDQEVRPLRDAVRSDPSPNAPVLGSVQDRARAA